MKQNKQHFPGKYLFIALSILLLSCSTFSGGLLEAVMNDDVSMTKQLLAEGADPNEKDTEWGVSPLKIAAALGNIAIVSLLVDAGADVDIADNTGATPLHAAAQHGQLDVIGVLLKHGADVNAVDNTHGISALHIAIFNKRNDVVEYLLNHGADPNISGKRGQTPIRAAVETGNRDIVALLMDHGARTLDAGSKQEHAELLAYFSGYYKYLYDESVRQGNKSGIELFEQQSSQARQKSIELGISTERLGANIADGMQQSENDLAQNRSANMASVTREMKGILSIYSN